MAAASALTRAEDASALARADISIALNLSVFGKILLAICGKPGEKQNICSKKELCVLLKDRPGNKSLELFSNIY